MERPDSTRACPTAPVEMASGVDWQSLVSEDRLRREEKSVVLSKSFVAGVIVDSWVEPASPVNAGARLVLQIAPRGHPEVLVVVEAEASLVSDRLLLEDLSENLCHGNPVLALGSRSLNGFFIARRLHLMP